MKMNPFKNSVQVDNIDEYIKLPKSERTTNGWWYKPVWGFKMKSAFDRTEPDKYYAFLKKEFPIQYFFREYLDGKVSHYKFRLSMFYWNKIRPIFKPQHSELRKVIPRTWSDITELIPMFLFECVKSFKENETDTICWDSDELHKTFYANLNKYYNYITVERKQLIDIIDNSYPPHGAEGSYEELYSKLNANEAILKDKDTECLTWIITNREGFWS
jgi:hypothetical protein